MFLIFFSFLYIFNNSTEERIIQKAFLFSPPELKIIIKDNYIEFEKGINEGRKQTIKVEEIEDTIKKLSRHFYEKKPVENFIYDLGRISVQTIRFSNVLNTPEEKIYEHIRKDFPLFIEKKLKKFPIVFYGFDRNFFKGKIKNYIEFELINKKDYLILLKTGYIKGNIIFDRFSMDERSNSFGIAQIFTNKSFSLILNIWYYIWIKNGGRWDPLKPHQTNDKLWVLAYGY